MRVAAVSQTDETIIEPDFDAAESDRIEVNPDELAAKVRGDLPDRCAQRDGGVFSHATT